MNLCVCLLKSNFLISPLLFDVLRGPPPLPPVWNPRRVNDFTASSERREILSGNSLAFLNKLSKRFEVMDLGNIIGTCVLEGWLPPRKSREFRLNKHTQKISPAQEVTSSVP